MEDSQTSHPRNLDHAGNSAETIPFDLTFELLLRLPTKSIIRFQSVSKRWFSIIRRKEFVDSFLARSKTRPRLLFTVKQFDSQKHFIFSSPENQKNNNPTTAVVARHDMTISGLVNYVRSPPVNGFVCCTRGSSILVCNPNTRQIVTLPDVGCNGKDMFVRLGYDPVEDQYKVLCVIIFDGDDSSQQDNVQKHFVYTLSSQQKEWRKIENTTGYKHREVYGGICMDGAIFYGVDENEVMVRFDVRTEKLELIQVTSQESLIRITYYSTLLRYKMEMGGVDSHFSEEMRLWITEAGEKQQRSNMMCALPSEGNDLFGDYVRPKEVIYAELMVVQPRFLRCDPFRLSVCYYDLRRESLETMVIPGSVDDALRDCFGIGKQISEILSFPGYLENIRFL